MDLIDQKMKANDYLIKLIKTGKESGLSKKNAVIRAHRLITEEFGFDLSDAIPEEYTETYIVKTFIEKHEQIIIEAITAAIRANRRPTIKAIMERKRILKRLDTTEFNDLIQKLIDDGMILLDDSGRKPAYYHTGMF